MELHYKKRSIPFLRASRLWNRQKSRVTSLFFFLDILSSTAAGATEPTVIPLSASVVFFLPLWWATTVQPPSAAAASLSCFSCFQNNLLYSFFKFVEFQFVFRTTVDIRVCMFIGFLMEPVYFSLFCALFFNSTLPELSSQHLEKGFMVKKKIKEQE